MESPIAVPDTKEIEGWASTIERRAAEIQIVDDESNIEAQELLKEINAKLKVIEPILEEPPAAAHKLFKTLRVWADNHLNPFKSAKKNVSAKIGMWDMAIQEKRRQEAAVAEVRARKIAEAARAAQIAAAKASKDKEAVKELQSAPLIVTPIAPKTVEATKITGVNVRYKWVLDVIHTPGVLPREFLMPNEKAISERITSLGAAHGIPGVTAKQIPITSGRG